MFVVYLAYGWTDFAVNCFLSLDPVFVSVLSSYHRVARRINLLVNIKAEFRCVRASAKPRRRRSAAKIFVI